MKASNVKARHNSTSSIEMGHPTNDSSPATSVDDFGAYKPIPRRPFMTPAQLKALRTGPKVNIYIGPAGDRYVAIEGAYANVLKKYSGLAREKLASGVTALSVPADCKDSTRWAYLYMLAGETDAQITDKFDHLSLAQLAILYQACEALQYDLLANKVWNRLRFFIKKNGCADIDIQSLQLIALLVPSLVDAMGQSIVSHTMNGVFQQDIKHFKYVDDILEADGLGPLVDAVIHSALKSRNGRAKKYVQSQQAREAREQQKLANVECYTCGARGHIARNCTAAPFRAPAKASVKVTTKAAVTTPPKNPKPKATDQASMNAAALNPTKSSGKAPTKAPVTTPPKAPKSKATGKTSMTAAAIAPTKSSSTAPIKAPVKTKSLGPAPVTPVKETATAVKAPTKFPASAPAPTTTKTATAVKAPAKSPATAPAPAAEITTTAVKDSAKSPASAATTTKNTATSPKQAVALNPVARQSPRRGPTCYNCNKVGHIARNCYAAPKNNKPRGNNFSGRNASHRGNYIDVVLPSSNGEGITTCDYVLKPGQYTRLGLRV
jgi:hypothetical protein